MGQVVDPGVRIQGGLLLGGIVRGAYADQIQPLLDLIFLDQMGDQALHGAAAGGGHRKIRRRDQKQLGLIASC